ncbi:MAG: ACP phosphodiesterase [Chitinophagaceae bacterium]
MNYLGHAFFSLGNAEILAGQIIGDYVKGKQQYNYAPNIQKGIALHRLIDAFTDNHWAGKEAIQLFKPYANRYAPAFTDIVWDYFLANDTQFFFTEHHLNLFAQRSYQQLAAYQPVFPSNFQGMFNSMQQHNWLYNYRTLFGMEKSFQGLIYRASGNIDFPTVFNGFVNQIPAFQQLYKALIPDVKKQVDGFFEENDLPVATIFVK